MAHTTTHDEPGPRTPSPLASELPVETDRGGGPSTVAPPNIHPSISSSPTIVPDDQNDHLNAASAASAAVAAHGTAGTAGGAPLPPTSTLAAPALLPPSATLTPATTTLGVSHSTHIASAHELHVPDLATASTSSVPSTTTSLTNVLPPTQSAALRALNAPAFQSFFNPPSSHPQSKSKPAKSASSRTTLSSQPVVVRTYSGSRHKSRYSTSSANPSPRYINMNRPRTSHHPNGNSSALSAGLADARREPKLPSVDSFSFSAILRAVDPEIRDAIDAIAEICARSRYSLADEYDAHLPPQGEITAGGVREIGASRVGSGGGRTASSNSSRGRLARVGQGWGAATAERTLVSVPEASSSSERSVAGEGSRRSSAAGKKGRSQSAYGSLKSVISGGSGNRNVGQRRKSTGTSLDDKASSKPIPTAQSKHYIRTVSTPTWSIINPLFSSTKPHDPASPSAQQPERPAITITTTPRASHQLSLDTSSTIKHVLPSDDSLSQTNSTLQNGHAVPRPQTADPAAAILRSSKGHSRNASSGSSVLATLASWVPLWTGRMSRGAGTNHTSRSRAEGERQQDENLMLAEVKERLRGMLKGDGAAA